MEILILESPLRFVLYPLGPWKSQPTYTAGSAVCQQLCILRQSFDAPCSIVATPLLATLARALPGAAVGPFPAFIQLCLALARTEVPTARGLVHELKLDGYRVQAHVRNGRVTRRWRA